jgi:hypothetical protein
LPTCHAECNEQDEFLELEYGGIRHAIAIGKEADKTSWLGLVKTKGNRKRIGIITSIGFFP